MVTADTQVQPSNKQDPSSFKVGARLSIWSDLKDSQSLLSSFLSLESEGWATERKHCDVTVNLTFTPLDGKCHHFFFCQVAHMKSWVRAKNVFLWGQWCVIGASLSSTGCSCQICQNITVNYTWEQFDVYKEHVYRRGVGDCGRANPAAGGWQVVYSVKCAYAHWATNIERHLRSRLRGQTVTHLAAERQPFGSFPFMFT